MNAMSPKNLIARRSFIAAVCAPPLAIKVFAERPIRPVALCSDVKTGALWGYCNGKWELLSK